MPRSAPELFASRDFPQQWIAWMPTLGWVVFPAIRDGWQRLQPAPPFDPLTINRINSEQAFNTGFPGAPYEVLHAPVSAIREKRAA
jgi:hypothetical protein